ncbi:tetratricopeptide repeat protein 8 isoform X2 [Ranitomeya variabilis]|uniref:tetratricopeptide repeat protein 8 isoform X2 n=1 Tax=Ranitomeya variabilis TaxID=490064 RepID=UPI004057454A
MGLQMDPLLQAWSYFRRRKFEQCSQVCGRILEKEPCDQAAWSLKTRALTEMVYVDEIDVDQEGIAEVTLDENSIAQVARPGTSIRQATAKRPEGPSPAVRPVTQSGRPLTGFVRPSTQSGRPGTMEQAIRTPRTAHTARPITSASGRYIRLGTALELAALATENAQFKDWWWKVQLGKCYYRLGLFREAESQFKSALVHQEMVDTYLYLGKVCARMDQPLTALSVYKQGLDRFPKEVTLLCAVARIHEEMNNLTSATEYYKDLLKQDNTHVEAIACIGSNHFYTDQPEIALRFYRRLLQMGVYNCELFNNLGLCCFYAQQYDMILTSFERALSLAENDEDVAEVWYNLGHVAVGIGDLTLAYQCFKLTLANNNNHAEAYNNLAVLEMRKSHIEQARALLQTSAALAPHMYEPHFNFACLSDKIGDLQSSYVAAQKSEAAFPDHVETQQLLDKLRQHFAVI